MTPKIILLMVPLCEKRNLSDRPFYVLANSNMTLASRIPLLLPRVAVGVIPILLPET
jgi:hypothetical protein